MLGFCVENGVTAAALLLLLWYELIGYLLMLLRLASSLRYLPGETLQLCRLCTTIFCCCCFSFSSRLPLDSAPLIILSASYTAWLFCAANRRLILVNLSLNVASPCRGMLWFQYSLITPAPISTSSRALSFFCPCLATASLFCTFCRKKTLAGCCQLCDSIARVDIFFGLSLKTRGFAFSCARLCFGLKSVSIVF